VAKVPRVNPTDAKKRIPAKGGLPMHRETKAAIKVIFAAKAINPAERAEPMVTIPINVFATFWKRLFSTGRG